MKIPELSLYIANVLIRIKFQNTKDKPWIYEYFSSSIKTRYKEYIILTKKNVDFTINVNFQEETPHVYVDKKSKISYIEFCQDVGENKMIVYYHISSMAFNQVILKIIDKILSQSEGFILHASALCYNREACIFLANSGGGKSMMTQVIDKDIKIINDDHVAIRKRRDGYRIFSLPELKPDVIKNKVTDNNFEGFRINKIFFLQKNKIWSIGKVTDIEKHLFNQLLTHNAYRAKSMKNLLRFLGNNSDKFYCINFPKNPKSIDYKDTLNRIPEKGIC